MSQQLLDNLSASEERGEARAMAAYRELVRSMADDGAEPELAAVQLVLVDAGKNADALRTDIGKRRNRNGLKAQLQEISDAHRELPELAEKIAAADAVLEAAKAEHANAVRPLYWKKQEITSLLMTEHDIRARLRAGSDPNLQRQAKSAWARVRWLDNQCKPYRDLVENIHDLIKAEKNRRRPGADREWLAEHEGRGGDPAKLKALQARLENAEKAMSQAGAQYSQALEEANRLQAELEY